MENELLFTWEDDAGINAVSVTRAGPTAVLLETRHGPIRTVVRLPRWAARDLADVLTAHVDSTEPVAIVEQVIRLNSRDGSSERTAVWVVDALRVKGYLATGDAPENT